MTESLSDATYQATYQAGDRAAYQAADLDEDVSLDVHRRPRTSIVRSAARGAIAAMAMSGLRQLTTSLGMVKATPPESVIAHTAPRLFQRIPVERRQGAVEIVHWLYGAAGGACFGAMPRAVRANPWSGPVFGVLSWVAFETAIAPVLGLPRPENTARERIALLADHVLYGVVVGASPWPHRDQ
ncbi:hypothetical protein HII36_45070 [Nonomuraea sp. NN258]|uniref:hypothetical protein n=1 Tax=Nonomuraea antri TaxID=2730852 RepID=UPI00156909AE|nr:hypothetical protein [Nonomuraea antri]NRQ38945.1 hypothetical protein [Nonomuraea antri]